MLRHENQKCYGDPQIRSQNVPVWIVYHYYYFFYLWGGEGCLVTQCRIAGVVAEVLDCFVHVFLIEKCGDGEARSKLICCTNLFCTLTTPDGKRGGEGF